MNSKIASKLKMTDPIYQETSLIEFPTTEVLMYTFKNPRNSDDTRHHEKLKISPDKKNLEDLLITHDPRKDLRLAYNPFEELVLRTYLTTMEIVSIFHAINPISCRPPNLYDIDANKYVYLDLDETAGASVAMQVFYPNSYCYGLSQATGKDWNFVGNRFDIRNFMIQSATIESLRHLCFLNNPRGIDAAFVTTKINDSNISRWEKLFAGISILLEDGFLMYRFYHRYSDDDAQMIFLASQCFRSIELYKPACSPCDDSSVYLIGHFRKTDPNSQNILTFIQNKSYTSLTRHFVEWNLYATNFLLENQITAIQSIDNKVDRRHIFNLGTASGLWMIPISYNINQ